MTEEEYRAAKTEARKLGISLAESDKKRVMKEIERLHKAIRFE